MKEIFESRAEEQTHTAPPEKGDGVLRMYAINITKALAKAWHKTFFTQKNSLIIFPLSSLSFFIFFRPKEEKNINQNLIQPFESKNLD